MFNLKNMFLTKEVQFVKISDSKYIILNLINGAADYINEKIYNDLLDNRFDGLDSSVIERLKDRKYLFDSIESYNIFIDQFELKIKGLEEDSAPNFLLVPSYACNLNCKYCYEKTYSINYSNIEDTKQIVNNQFNVINNIVEKIVSKNLEISNEDIKITIMGGEPLLKSQKDVIEYIIQKAESYGYMINIISNGIDVDSFLPLLKSKTVEYLQITIDGTKDYNDKRRIFYSGKGTFDRIMSNVKLLLENNIKVNLRINVDNENIDNMPELADYIVDYFPDTSNLKPYIYILQDGGNSGEENVLDECDAMRKFFDFEKKNKNMSIIRKKSHAEIFINSILNNDKFQPVLRHCGASKNQYILDYKGNIYKCRHGIGNGDYKTGSFDEDYEFSDKHDLWKNRSVDNIDECKSCKYRYICGTGCPATTHGKFLSHDIDKPSCIDYERLIELFVLEYFKE